MTGRVKLSTRDSDQALQESVATALALRRIPHSFLTSDGIVVPLTVSNLLQEYNFNVSTSQSPKGEDLVIQILGNCVVNVLLLLLGFLLGLLGFFLVLLFGWRVVECICCLSCKS